MKDEKWIIERALVLMKRVREQSGFMRIVTTWRLIELATVLELDKKHEFLLSEFEEFAKKRLKELEQ